MRRWYELNWNFTKHARVLNRLWYWRLMRAPSLVHSMVRAHAQRTRDLADMFGSLDEAVHAGGHASERARVAHRALTDSVCRWIAADVRAEHQDFVSITADERAQLRRDIGRLV